MICCKEISISVSSGSCSRSGSDVSYVGVSGQIGTGLSYVFPLAEFLSEGTPFNCYFEINISAVPCNMQCTVEVNWGEEFYLWLWRIINSYGDSTDDAYYSPKELIFNIPSGSSPTVTVGTDVGSALDMGDATINISFIPI